MKILRSRAVLAAVGTFALSLGSGSAAAQSTQAGHAPVYSAVQQTLTSATNIFSSTVGSVFGTVDPRRAEQAKIAREGAWLYRSGWPLYALIDRYSTGVALDDEATCLATAVYFEARGESPEGQLAVARVVMNRAASGKYPASWCQTVKQPWQFSFVRHGQFPAITDMESWRKAQGVARLAMANAVPSIPADVLRYHADYCSPSWGARLTEVSKIGAHIFYRA